MHGRYCKRCDCGYETELESEIKKLTAELTAIQHELHLKNQHINELRELRAVDADKIRQLKR